MKKILFRGLLFFFMTPVAAQTGYFYVGTFTSEGAEGIYYCSFNTGTGEMAIKEIFKGIDNPNFLRISPDGNYLFTVTRPPQVIEPDGGAVSSFRIEEDGGLSFINKQSSHGDDPCYVDISGDGKFVAAANYGGGSVVLFPVKGDGSLLPATSVIHHEGSGPNSRRQKQPYAHSIRFSGKSDLIWAADLGADKLFAYRLDTIKKILLPAVPPFVSLPPGSGPRHFVWSPDENQVYVANELISSVTLFEKSPLGMKEIETVSTLPVGYTGVSYCADIHLSPDGKQLYVSNRGDNSIAVFNRDAVGRLSLLKVVSAEGDWPRNFTIDPSGRFMLVANQRSHNITVFRLEKGIPVYSGKELKIPAPVCLEFR